MRELDDVEHAEEQREADRDQRIHHAEHQPVHDVLGEQACIHVVDVRAHPRWRIRRRGGRQPAPAPPRVASVYFCPGSLRLPLAYSLSSHSTNLPSWTTYLVITGTVFWPWSSKVILPTIESRSFTLPSSAMTFLRSGPDLLDGVEDHVHRGIGEGAVGLGRIVVFLRVVFFHEELAARQLLGRRAFAEGERAFGQRAEALDVGVGHDAGGAVEHRLDAELVHLRADAHADRRQPAEIDHFRIERLDLGELGGEVLLVGGDAEGADDLGLADLGQRLAEIFVVALAVVGGVVDHRDGLVAELGDQLGVGVVLVDHRAVDAMHLGIFVAIGDVGQHRAPDDHRKAELVIDVDGRDRGRRAIMRRAGDDVLVGRHLGRDLHRDVRLALVVEHDHLVFVFRLGIGVAQPHREVGRVAAAEAVDRNAAGERADEADFDLVLGFGSDCCSGKRQRRDGHSSKSFTHALSLQHPLRG